MSVLSTLFSPLTYIKIQHPLKQKVDIFAPLMGLVIGGILGTTCSALNIFGSNGIIVGTNGLLQILAGFFITSLAAVATFSGSSYSIDDPFEGAPAILNGDTLSRRQFLCQAFAYLALCSMFLYLFGVVLTASAPTFHEQFTVVWRLSLRAIAGGAYLAALGHVIGTTLVGLVFLSSRMAWVSQRDRYHAVASSSVATSDAPARETSAEAHN